MFATMLAYGHALIVCLHCAHLIPCLPVLQSNGVVDRSVIKRILAQHNSMRRRYGAGSLSWSSTLAKSAQQGANSCSLSHDIGNLRSRNYGETFCAILRRPTMPGHASPPHQHRTLCSGGSLARGLSLRRGGCLLISPAKACATATSAQWHSTPAVLNVASHSLAGENLAMGTTTWRQAIKLWSQESGSYNWRAATFQSNAGHLCAPCRSCHLCHLRSLCRSTCCAHNRHGLRVCKVSRLLLEKH